MKVRLDVGEPVDMHAATPHSIAGLLKMWLRELPEPLLTFEMYAAIIATVRTLQQQQQHDAVLDALTALMQQLPAAHRRTLDALLAFLHRVSECSEVNLMTASNLAICFSPNILRPRIETLESVARDSPLAIAAIAALIRRDSQPHVANPTPLQPVSPLSPTSPTAASSVRLLHSMPPPIPPPASPRSTSLTATGSTSHHAHTAGRSPPPIPSGVIVALGQPLPSALLALPQPPPSPPHTATGKFEREEYKCADGQADAEQWFGA